MAINCSWNRKIINAQERFRVLSEFNNEAVLDRETGLVWERTPSTQAVQWPNARLLCAQKGVGGRGGWRLPAFDELSSLVDSRTKRWCSAAPARPPVSAGATG